MPEFPSTHKEKVLESGAKAPFDRLLVVRAEKYVAAHPGRKLAEQSPADLDAYLAALGRSPRVEGWQVRQATDAIRMRLELAGARWVDEVDRAHWQVSAQHLRPSHPTVARDYESVAPDRAPDAMPFAAIRAAHGPILERASAEARVRGLSIRTEQTCRHRVIRSICFLGDADPAEKGAGEVAEQVLSSPPWLHEPSAPRRRSLPPARRLRIESSPKISGIPSQANA